jgi:hypothetical protein
VNISEECHMAYPISEDAHVPGLAARSLARAVIKQALADALDPTVARSVRHDARLFLQGDRWYREWCSVADIDPTPLIQRRAAWRKSAILHSV